MRRADKHLHRGSAMIMAVFMIALAAALVMGMLQLNTEQVMLLRNQIGLTRAGAVAEAGLNDALAQLRSDIDWNDGFADKPFDAGHYTVTVTGTAPRLEVTSVGRTDRNFCVRLEAQVFTEDVSPPYRIRIEQLRINP